MDKSSGIARKNGRTIKSRAIFTGLHFHGRLSARGKENSVGSISGSRALGIFPNIDWIADPGIWAARGTARVYGFIDHHTEALAHHPGQGNEFDEPHEEGAIGNPKAYEEK